MYCILVCPQYTGPVAEGFTNPANESSGEGDLGPGLSLSGRHTNISSWRCTWDLLSCTNPFQSHLLRSSPGPAVWMGCYWAGSLPCTPLSSPQVAVSEQALWRSHQEKEGLRPGDQNHQLLGPVRSCGAKRSPALSSPLPISTQQGTVEKGVTRPLLLEPPMWNQLPLAWLVLFCHTERQRLQVFCLF